jgi:hypothetical protein
LQPLWAGTPAQQPKRLAAAARRPVHSSTLAPPAPPVAQTGRIHMLPPEKRPLQRPTFFFLF